MTRERARNLSYAQSYEPYERLDGLGRAMRELIRLHPKVPKVMAVTVAVTFGALVIGYLIIT